MIGFRIDNLKSMTAKLEQLVEYLRSENISDDSVFFSRLVSCELISNAVRHSGFAEFSCELLPDRIAVTVYSPIEGKIDLDPPRPPVFAESGRGLYIINAVSMNGVHTGERGELTVYIRR